MFLLCKYQDHFKLISKSPTHLFQEMQLQTKHRCLELELQVCSHQWIHSSKTLVGKMSPDYVHVHLKVCIKVLKLHCTVGANNHFVYVQWSFYSATVLQKRDKKTARNFIQSSKHNICTIYMVSGQSKYLNVYNSYAHMSNVIYIF